MNKIHSHKVIAPDFDNLESTFFMGRICKLTEQRYFFIQRRKIYETKKIQRMREKK